MANTTKQTSIHTQTLTKDRVIEAAINLADIEGLEKLSMRKLGRILNVEAMAFYHHFANKGQLIDGMIDRIHGLIEVSQGNLNWQEYMYARAENAFAVLLLHPWAAPIMESGINPGPSTLRDSDNCIKCFREAGFSIEMTVHAVTMLNIYIYGAAAQYAKLSFSNSEEAAKFSETIKDQFPISDYPYLGEVITKYMMTKNYDALREFEFGLNLLLDGIANFATKK